MAGEYIQSDTIVDYWKQLRAFYFATTPTFKEISQQIYESFPQSEREDSDNHLNEERLGEDTQAVDITFYKYLPNNIIAYRCHIVDISGKEEVHYFTIQSVSVSAAD